MQWFGLSEVYVINVVSFCERWKKITTFVKYIVRLANLRLKPSSLFYLLKLCN